jgi:hypothetical protein
MRSTLNRLHVLHVQKMEELHAQQHVLQTQKNQLEKRLEEALAVGRARPTSLDTDTPIDKTLHLLDSMLSGHQPSPEEARFAATVCHCRQTCATPLCMPT